MTSETLAVPRAPFDIEEPWTVPKECTPVRLRRAGDASVPRLATTVAAWFDDDFLSILFCAADDRLVATHFAHDAPLYEQDVVEAFLAPADAHEYFEIEVSPRGTVFDARIHSPDGVRATMSADRGWNCEGLVAAVRTVMEGGLSVRHSGGPEVRPPFSNGAMTVDTLLRLPFASLGRPTPSPGETWRGNFFRIDRHPQLGDEYTAWQPTLRIPADFHVTAAFGTLRFAS
ncbi:MAG TPA: carbohydrate-binding family 9-like protein [Thermoanaerobaculia bacterium]|nr:carbohydrate-binding family 9-like protein [Thermoanaerobaculia bacterium]